MVCGSEDAEESDRHSDDDQGHDGGQDGLVDCPSRVIGDDGGRQGGDQYEMTKKFRGPYPRRPGSVSASVSTIAGCIPSEKNDRHSRAGDEKECNEKGCAA